MKSPKYTLVFQNTYTLEELYGILEKIPFAAGHPLLIHRGARDLIVWPQLDPVNQVQIIRRRDSFYCIRSSHPAGPDRRPKTLWKFLFTRGPSAVIDECTAVRMDCDAMVLRIFQQISSLGL